jgi:hypothetical protein
MHSTRSEWFPSAVRTEPIVIVKALRIVYQATERRGASGGFLYRQELCKHICSGAEECLKSLVADKSVTQV